MISLERVIKNKNTKASVSYLIGNLFDKAIVFITIPIFTRIMSTEDYGIVNTYLSWVSILSLIVGLSLTSSIRSAYNDFSDNIEEYIYSILSLALINFLLITIVTIVVSKFFLKEVNITLIILCLIQSFMTFIINIMSTKYMMELEYSKRTMILAVPNIIITILSIIMLINMVSNKYYGRIIPYVIVTSIIGIYYLYRYIKRGLRVINICYWKYAIKLSLPLIFHGICINILATSDRTIITMFKGASETGIYSLVYNFSMVASVVTTALESVWIPWFNKKLQNNEKAIINHNVKFYIEIIMIVMIGILMISPEILILIAPKEYWSGRRLIPFILLSSFFIFLYSISVNLEYYYKSTKVIASNTVIAAFINLGLNFIFIPKYGAIGATLTTVFSYVISFIIHYKVARKLDYELFPLKIYIKPIIIMLNAALITYLTINYIALRWIILIIGICIYILVLIKKDIFKLFLENC